MAPELSSADRAHLPVTERTRHRRAAARGSHGRALIHAILDEALVCHVGVVVGGGPRVMPTAHVRVGEELYLHGSRGSAFLRALAEGAAACVTVTLLDGLVFARSAFHHSVNYRSVMLFGRARRVEDRDEKRRALLALVDHMAAGRSAEARPPTDTELDATLVVALPIAEASAKVRSGPPIDDADDLSLPVWAGQLPVALAPGAPLGEGEPSASIARRAQGRAAAPDRTPAAAPDHTPMAATALDHTPVAATAPDHTPVAALASDPVLAYERQRGPYTITCEPERVDFALVHRFLAEESYWALGVDAEVQRRAMRHCLGFGLYEGARQLGYARVVTDWGRFAYLADVFIVPEARGRGLGKWLVECVLDHPALREVPLFLLGTADAHGLYERHGFQRAPEGRYMVRRRGGDVAATRRPP